MTIKELVYDLRQSIQEINKDSELSDELLEYWINAYRAILIRRDLDKGRSVSTTITQDIGCLKLICVPTIDCCGLSLSEPTILRTELPVPPTIELPTKDLTTYVGLCDHLTPIPIESIHQIDKLQYSKYTKNKRAAFALGEYWYVVNGGDLQYIRVRGVYEDPRKANNLSVCGGRGDCQEDFEYPMSSYMVPMLKEYLIKQEIGTFYLAPRDTINNSNNDRSSVAQQAQRPTKDQSS